MPQTTRRRASKSVSQKAMSKHSKLLNIYMREQSYCELCPSRVHLRCVHQHETVLRTICIRCIEHQPHSAYFKLLSVKSIYNAYSVSRTLYLINNLESPFRQPTALPTKTARSVRSTPAEGNSTKFRVNTREIYEEK